VRGSTYVSYSMHACQRGGQEPWCQLPEASPLVWAHDSGAHSCCSGSACEGSGAARRATNCSLIPTHYLGTVRSVLSVMQACIARLGYHALQRLAHQCHGVYGLRFGLLVSNDMDMDMEILWIGLDWIGLRILVAAGSQTLARETTRVLSYHLWTSFHILARAHDLETNDRVSE
jgi:hypothetical protein